MRALANQPLHLLARISPDPAGAWRARDPQVVAQLAALEMHDVGLRPPPWLVGGPASRPSGIVAPCLEPTSAPT